MTVGSLNISNRKYGPSIVHAAPSLEAFYDPAAHSESFLPDQMPVNTNLARPLTEEELRYAIAHTLNGSAVGADMAPECCVGDAFQNFYKGSMDSLSRALRYHRRSKTLYYDAV